MTNNLINYSQRI